MYYLSMCCVFGMWHAFYALRHPSQFGPVTLQVLVGHSGLVAVVTEQLWLSHILWLFLLSKLHLGRGIVKPCPGEIFLLLNFCGLLGINLFYCLYIFSVQLPMINPWGWGDDSVFAMEAQGSEFNPQNPVTLILPCAWSPWTGRWRQGDPWGPLASRSHLICKLWVQ